MWVQLVGKIFYCQIKYLRFKYHLHSTSKANWRVDLIIKSNHYRAKVIY